MGNRVMAENTQLRENHQEVKNECVIAGIASHERFSDLENTESADGTNGKLAKFAQYHVPDSLVAQNNWYK